MTAPFDKSGIVGFFLLEAGEHIQNLNRGLLSLKKDPTDTAVIDELFRDAHTLKGSAAMMGFHGISDVAHKSEDILGMFRTSAVDIRKETLDFLFDSVDAVKRMVDGVAAGRPEDPLIVETIRLAYQGVVEIVQKPAAPEPSAPSTAAPLPASKASAGTTLKQEPGSAVLPGFFERRGFSRRTTDSVDLEKQFVGVDINRFDNLMNLVGEMIVGRSRLSRHADLIKSLRDELAFSQSRLLREIKRFEEKFGYTPTACAPPSEEAGPPSADIPALEFDRYDEFNLLSSKLTEITNDTNEIMTQLAGVFDSVEIDAAGILTITTGMQEEITMVRMVEMDKLFQMFQRPVLGLAREEGKEIKLAVSGGETKIDRTIFELITDPLMHMIRNAVSHGLEPAAERRSCGKDPAGSLILAARHEGNSIIIQIEDDGRGMDPAVLRKTAVDRGLLREAEARSLSDAEAVNLIFRPGFSTPSRAGASGRDVGMDDLATHLSRINGRIEVRTEPGVGTKFMIHLPLTLAIAQALVVKLGDQELAVPINFVEETASFSSKDIRQAGGEETVNLRGTLLKLYKLNHLLGVGRFPIKDEAYRHPALILGMAGKRIALLVEELTGREEIVVKPLGEFLKSVRLFSGASISGEGDVRLIINVFPLFDEEGAAGYRTCGCTGEETSASGAAKRKPRVLVVDDSISVRKYVKRSLVRAGYEVEAAPGGVEALNIMGRMKFDAVMVDLEMPVMHGSDLMAEMRKSPDLMNIPVIVLTARAGDKHRQKATETGARDCLVKPFDERDMTAALKRLLVGVAPAALA